MNIRHRSVHVLAHGADSLQAASTDPTARIARGLRRARSMNGLIRVVGRQVKVPV
jgi:hypothetical protein